MASTPPPSPPPPQPPQPPSNDPKGPKKTAPAAKARPADGAVDPVLAKLVDESLAKTDFCPQCKAPVPKGAVLCPSCGFNSTTGKQVRTTYISAPKEKAARSGGSRSLGDMFSPQIVFVLSLLLVGGAFAYAMVDQEMGGVALLIAGSLVSSVAFFATIICMILDKKFFNLIMLLVPIAQAYFYLSYVFRQHRGQLKAVVGASMIGSCMTLVFFYAIASDESQGTKSPPAAVSPNAPNTGEAAPGAGRARVPGGQ